MLEILLFVPHFKYWHHQKRNFSKFYLMLRFPLFFWLKISPNYVFPLKTMDLCLLLWLCILGPAHSRFWKFCKINQSLTTRPHLLYKNSKQEQPYATWKIWKTFLLSSCPNYYSLKFIYSEKVQNLPVIFGIT